jgi:NAD(P)-dependent dehydrogenase (short-subunit alcohol dehydrogenase family)
MNKEIVIITGGGSGIGAATAEIYLANNHKVLICGRDNQKLENFTDKLSKNYPQDNIASMQCDVAKESDVKQLFEYCNEKFGSPSILINNAAIIKVESFIEISMQDWDEIQNINIRGAVLAAKQAFNYMQKTGGNIINISSLGGLPAYEKFPGFTAYCVSKSALIGLTESLAVEGKEYNIRVNAIAAGAVATDMLAKAAPNLKTNTYPKDIAKTIYNLADNKNSAHITGSIIPINSNA